MTSRASSNKIFRSKLKALLMLAHLCLKIQQIYVGIPCERSRNYRSETVKMESLVTNHLVPERKISRRPRIQLHQGTIARPKDEEEKGSMDILLPSVNFYLALIRLRLERRRHRLPGSPRGSAVFLAGATRSGARRWWTGSSSDCFPQVRSRIHGVGH